MNNVLAKGFQKEILVLGRIILYLLVVGSISAASLKLKPMRGNILLLFYLLSTMIIPMRPYFLSVSNLSKLGGFYLKSDQVGVTTDH